MKGAPIRIVVPACLYQNKLVGRGPDSSLIKVEITLHSAYSHFTNACQICCKGLETHACCTLFANQ